ncbi:hypothetical protein BG005_008066 [Podila minutissima]|nr:hypothetical protein BG005_008066 [Podila minutissima]
MADPQPHHQSSTSVPSTPMMPSSSSVSIKPHAIAIISNQSLEAPQQSPTRRGSIAAHIMNLASRSTTSLNVLSTSAPASSGPETAEERGAKPSILSGRSLPFSNPFKKLQYSLQGGSRKNFELGPRSTDKEKEKVISSSASAMTLTSWRSKAEMLSKKSWGRSRKNSEPTFGGLALPQTPVFGASLDDAIRSSHIQGTPMIPTVLFRCAEFLEAKGVDEVGLYRVPGSHASVQKLKKMFDSGKDFNLLAMDGVDPNDIATLLKLYLRELPTPLLPAFLLEQFQSVITTDRHICHTLRGILVRLPRHNYVVLSFLCHHLSRIAAHSEKTKMNVSNLGVVFAPTLSIGSVLFRALLGGYYDTEDTPESREKGLKIVWGGLLQEFEYDIQEWPEEGNDGRLHPLELESTMGEKNQLQGSPLLQRSVEEQNSASNDLFVPSVPSVTAFSQSMPSDHQFPSLATTPTPAGPLTAEQEETKHLQAMLHKEKMASECDDDEVSSNASLASSNPCTENTALSAISSPGLSAKEQAFEASFTSPSMTFSPTLSAACVSSTPSHLTATAITPNPFTTTSFMTTGTTTTTSTSSDGGFQTTIPSTDKSPPSLPTLNFDNDAGSTSNGTTPDTQEHKSPSGAPQLPPLEGLMISL